MGVRAAHALDHLPTVVLADDHQAMLKRVTDILSPRFKVVAAVDNGKSALDAMARASPDVAVLDIMMPQLDGITVARELKRRDSDAKIVFLTAQEDDDYISEALRAGARGYVVKRRLQTELVPALDLVIGGKFFVSPHPFGGKGQAENGHLLNLYLEDSAFFDQVSQLACAALRNGEQVFVLLCKAGLRSVNTQLAATGLNLIEAIGRRQYSCFRVENLIELATWGTHPEASLFDSFLCGILLRAAARARERGSRLNVFSNAMATLLKRDRRPQFVAQVETFWKDLVSRHSCLVYSGCPVTHLGSKENRETLSAICCEHSIVSAQN